MPSTKRRYWMDLLNVIACFAVVMLHCTTSVFLNTGDQRWIIDVVVQSIFIFAVPVFFMISGANLLGYRHKYDTKTFFKRRFKKVVFALVAASVIMYVVPPLIANFATNEPIALSPKGFIEGFFHNSICDIYWFFYAILGLYLVTPVFSLLAENKRLLQYAIAICIVTTMIIPLVNRFAPDHALLNLFSYPYLSGWLTYYLLGYYLVNYEKEVRAIPCILIALASVSLMALMTLKTNLPHTASSGAYSPYDGFYANASNILALTYSSAVFTAFSILNLSVGNWRGYPLCRKLSALSLGIYAIHMLVITTLDFYIPHSTFWDVAIRPFVVFGISALLTFAGRAIMGLVAKARVLLDHRA